MGNEIRFLAALTPLDPKSIFWCGNSIMRHCKGQISRCLSARRVLAVAEWAEVNSAESIFQLDHSFKEATARKIHSFASRSFLHLLHFQLFYLVYCILFYVQSHVLFSFPGISFVFLSVDFSWFRTEDVVKPPSAILDTNQAQIEILVNTNR